MGMKIVKGFAVVLMALASTASMAHDFSAVVPSGQTLYFNVVNGAAVVTYPADVTTPITGWNGYTRPTGALTIPATISNGTETYSVVAVGNHALYGCSGLTSLAVSDGVVAIRGHAFNGCSSITSIDLPSTLDTIGSNAFKDCTSLAQVMIHRSTPPVTNAAAFADVNLASCALGVSCQSVENYADAYPWSQFGSIVDAGCTATLFAAANYAGRGSVSGGGSYTVGTSVVLHANPAAGHFFACWSDGDTLNPRVVSLYNDIHLTAFFFAFLHDTVVPGTPLHDTVYVTSIQHDTVLITIHDTVTLHDGGQPTFYHLQVSSGDPALGTAAGSCIVPAGSVIEICALPFAGFVFSRWLDGSTENPRRVQVVGDETYTALFSVGQGSAATAHIFQWNATVNGRTLTVACAATEHIRIIDLQGRTMAETTATADRTTFVLPQAGAFLVQVGDAPARKFVVAD